MTRRFRATWQLSAVLALTLFLPRALRAPVTPPPATAIFAGGCYWGMESVFRHVRGVESVVSGFATPAGAAEPGAHLPARHLTFAEAVKISYDPSKITYRQLLEVYFMVAHDPTQLDRQGPDVGTRYRSAIFVEGDGQYAAARRYLERLKKSATYRRPIVTELVTLKGFKAAPPDQQDFAGKHPDMAYIRINDVPRIKALKARFPGLYRAP